ncbi:MAG: hypothetical protein KC561_08045 [Myxococcales bacterium]|nr:hypothetical protein [Myxococcales bacterium]
MTGPRRALVKRKASMKGWSAAAAASGTVAAFVLSAPIVGVVGLLGTGYLTYDWLKYRGKWGTRF